MEKYKKAVSLFTAFLILLSGLSVNFFVSADKPSDYTAVCDFGGCDLPSGVSLLGEDNDILSVSNDCSDGGLSLKLIAKGTDEAHFSGVVFGVESGLLSGKGISLWFKTADAGLSGAIALRATDSKGNSKWFRTRGTSASPAEPFSNFSSGGMTIGISYSELCLVNDWQTQTIGGTATAPAEEDIINFDQIVIGVYLESGSSDKVVYLDTVTSLSDFGTPGETPVDIMTFDESAEIPAGVKSGISSDTLAIETREGIGSGNSLKISSVGNGTSHLSYAYFSVSKGDLFGSGITFKMKGSFADTWGNVAFHATYSDGSEKWFAFQGQYGNPAFILNTANVALNPFDVTLNFTDLYQVADWRTSIVAGNEPRAASSDIACFDGFAIGYYIWADWSGVMPFYLDNIQLLGKMKAPVIDDLVEDFDGGSVLPKGVSGTAETDSVSLSTEFYATGSAVKIEAKGNSSSHVTGIIVRKNKGAFTADGITFWMKGPDTNTWGAVAMHATYPDGTEKWFKTNGQYGNPAYIMNQGDGSAFNISVNYSDLHEVDNWITGIPNYTPSPTEEDIACFDAVGIGIYMWANWPDKTAFIDSIRLVGKKSERLEHDTVIFDFGDIPAAPKGVSAVVGYGDSASLVISPSEEGCSAKLTAVKTATDRFTALQFETYSGNLYGMGIRFWAKSNISNLVGTVALRSTDTDGNQTWFKAELAILTTNAAQGAAYEYFYKDLGKVDNWKTDAVNAESVHPSDRNISDFDCIVIMLEVPANRDAVFYLDTIGVIEKAPAPSYDLGLVYNFNSLSTLPDSISATDANNDSISLSTENSADGKALKLDVKAIGITHNSGVTFSVKRGSLNGTGLSFWMMSQYPNTWGTVAFRSTDINGKTKWFKINGDYGNPASILSGSPGGFGYTVNYSQLYQVSDWLSAVPNGSEKKPTSADISGFDMVCIGCYMWDTWKDSSFWIDDIRVINPSEPTEYVDGLIEGFDAYATVPQEIQLLGRNTAVSITENGQTGKALKLTAAYGDRRISAVSIDIKPGSAEGDGLSFWLDDSTEAVSTGTVVLHISDENGSGQWYRRTLKANDSTDFARIFRSTDTAYSTRVSYKGFYAVSDVFGEASDSVPIDISALSEKIDRIVIGFDIPESTEYTVKIDNLAVAHEENNIICSFDWDNKIPQDFMISNENGDTARISDSIAASVNSLAFDLHSTGYNHSAYIQIPCKKGGLAGEGITFWQNTFNHDQWGSVLVRATDESGAAAWFKTIGSYGSAATVFHQGGAGESWVSVDYANMREVENWNDAAADVMPAPSVEDILNFDMLVIMPYIWDGNSDGTLYIDSIQVKNPYDPDNMPEIIPYEALWLEETELRMEAGDTVTLRPGYLPANATAARLKWTSDNPEIATVNSRGFVVAVSSGWVNITGLSQSTGLSVGCRIYVTGTDNNDYRMLESFDTGVLTDEITAQNSKIDMEYMHTGQGTGISASATGKKARITYHPKSPYLFYGDGFVYWSLNKNAAPLNIMFKTSGGKVYSYSQNCQQFGEYNSVMYSDLRDANGKVPNKADIREICEVVFELPDGLSELIYIDEFKVINPRNYQSLGIPRNDTGDTGLIIKDTANRLTNSRLNAFVLERGTDFDWAIRDLVTNKVIEYAYDAILWDISFIDMNYRLIGSIGEVELSCAVPSSHEGYAELFVVKICDNGTVINMNADVKNNSVTFKADESAIYALIGYVNRVSEPATVVTDTDITFIPKTETDLTEASQSEETPQKKLKRRKIVRRVEVDAEENNNTLLFVFIPIGTAILAGGITAVLVIRKKISGKGGH